MKTGERGGGTDIRGYDKVTVTEQRHLNKSTFHINMSTRKQLKA